MALRWPALIICGGAQSAGGTCNRSLIELFTMLSEETRRLSSVELLAKIKLTGAKLAGTNNDCYCKTGR